MYKRALVPLDGSPFAEAIVPFIMDVAGPLDLDVVLLRVVPPPLTGVADAPVAIVRDAADMLLADAREYIAPSAIELQTRGVRVTTDVRTGHPADEILKTAHERGARSGLGRLLFGSVAEAVLRRAEIPVFLMRMTADQVAARMARGVLR